MLSTILLGITDPRQSFHYLGHAYLAATVPSQELIGAALGGRPMGRGGVTPPTA